MFLSSQEIRGTEILVFPLSKRFFSIYYKKKEKFLLYLRKGKTPSLSKERKSPLNKNQEDSFSPPLLISLQPVEHSDLNTVCIIIGQSGSLTVIILAPGIGEEEAEILLPFAGWIILDASHVAECLAIVLVVAILAIKFFINYVTKYGFAAFGWYRIVVGLIIIICGLCGVDMQMVD